jgi:hypothetical protein
MRQLSAIVALLLASCSALTPRVAVPPAAVEVPAAVRVAPSTVARPASVGELDAAATDDWLQRTAEQRRLDAEPPPALDELLAAAAPPVTVEVVRYETCYGPYRKSYQHGTTFPVRTLTGAGLGALLSSKRHRDRGVAIGAGIGFLLDVAR